MDISEACAHFQGEKQFSGKKIVVKKKGNRFFFPAIPVPQREGPPNFPNALFLLETFDC